MIDYKELTAQYEFPVYPKRDITIVRGLNAKVWDDKGNEYIDCAAGIGVANVGHCNPKVVEAIYRQAQTLITCPGIFYNDTRALLLQKLVEIAPKNLTKAFLSNSGAESIEGAIKFARYTTGKTDFIAAMKGFHGRTMGALSATFKKDYKEGFGPLVEGFEFVPFNNYEALEEKITENTAGIILEVIQGEGGVNIGDKEYFEKVREICTQKEIILIIDEVQTGFCRTGKMFAVEHFGLQPDIMCVAKAIAGGLPMGAMLCSDKIVVKTGKHGTTFGGNPLACAAAIASIDFMQENNLAAQAEEKGRYFVNRVKDIKSENIRSVRNMGLMVGIELKEKVQPYIVELMNNGLLLMPAGMTTLRLLPPLTVEYELLDKTYDILRKVLEK